MISLWNYIKTFLASKEQPPKYKTLTLSRTKNTNDYTFGNLQSRDFDFFLYTLELPWRDNQSNISCIPDGLYECKHFDGFKFKDVWELQDVKNRSYILIHAGNTVKDIEGCILVGEEEGYLKGLKAVLKSRSALKDLKNYIGRDENGKLNTFLLNIQTID